MWPFVDRKSGFSLTELLCVIAIVSILAALYPGAISRAYVHIKKFLEGFRTRDPLLGQQR